MLPAPRASACPRAHCKAVRRLSPAERAPSRRAAFAASCCIVESCARASRVAWCGVLPGGRRQAAGGRYRGARVVTGMGCAGAGVSQADRAEPQVVESMAGLNVTAVTCGMFHTLCLVLHTHVTHVAHALREATRLTPRAVSSKC